MMIKKIIELERRLWARRITASAAMSGLVVPIRSDEFQQKVNDRAKREFDALYEMWLRLQKVKQSFVQRHPRADGWFYASSWT